MAEYATEAAYFYLVMGLNDSNYRKLVFSFIRNFPLNNVSEHLLYQITNSEWFRKGSQSLPL
uniref:Uncharacterized protein n=1 Tax=Leptospira santarosai serovar Arenal str. MAVJ 401 TaxID=1049976 RepID=M6JMP3_9LEPT|nr:hypothetical protein [Leptospira santarosai]EMN22971.1 hypothetical protein LEP1GSC063_3402 [Leptospira santarosai serovar Arenal str. MAVJ 401]